MRLLRRTLTPALLTLAGGLLLAPPASAQLIGPGSASRSSSIFVGAGNLNLPLGYIPEWGLGSEGSSLGAYLTFTDSLGFPTNITQSFSGMDSQGNPQTMTLSGTAAAEAEFGILHASASGSLTNPYYNGDNPAYYTGGDSPDPNGSPQYLNAVGHAGFHDTLTFNPLIDGIVGIKYFFRLEGNSADDQHAYAVLGFHAGGNGESFFSSDPSTPDWSTPEWSVPASNQIEIDADFAAVFGVNTNYFNTPEGVDVAASANYFDTLKLTGIQLLDANGNQVNGVSYLTASGTRYNVLGGVYGAASSVPEPGSLALLFGFGFTGAAFARKLRRSH